MEFKKITIASKPLTQLLPHGLQWSTSDLVLVPPIDYCSKD